MLKWVIPLIFTFWIIALIYPMSSVSLFDVGIIKFFEGLRTDGLTWFFLLISDIGSIKVALPLTFFVMTILIFRRDWTGVIYLAVIFYGVRKVNYELKEIFLRARPSFDAVYEAAHYSFPSGHSMNSAAIYSFICYIILSNFQGGRLFQLIFIFFTGLLIILIGLSRVYLGVHFLTDVIAGFSAGIAWFMIVVFLYKQTKFNFDKKRRN